MGPSCQSLECAHFTRLQIDNRLIMGGQVLVYQWRWQAPFAEGPVRGLRDPFHPDKNAKTIRVGALCFIKRRIGLTHELAGLLTVPRDERDANAGADLCADPHQFGSVSSRACKRLDAIFAAPAAPDTSRITIANSSPPVRASRSPSRRTDDMRVANLA